jgi:eukaryotic-like serine/threonine-protein kinase
MPQQKNKPWRARWRELRFLGKGGHGTTTVVEPLEGIAPEGEYVCKLLNNQNDGERRRRMFREVAASQTLDHPGVPRVIESNAQKYADTQEHLYLVTEFIDGPTLEDRISRARLPLAEATRLLMRLTEIVSYCHDRDVIHRDIKPDNLVLRNDSVDDPVLLDFGQSFNGQAMDEGALTASGQQLGNRFLALPELQLHSGNRRDPRSDLTQLCGILYFAITGARPVTLLDEASRLPHQRPITAAVLGSLSLDERTRLNRVFDVGFVVEIDHRFQSASALLAVLQLLAAPPTEKSNVSLDDRLLSLSKRLSASRVVAERARYNELLGTVDKTIKQALHDVQRKIPNRFGTVQSGHGIDLSKLRLSNRLGLFLVLDRDRKFHPTFEASFTGSELVVTGTDRGIKVELFRAPTAGPHRWKELRAAATRYFADGIDANCEGI